MNEPPRIQRIVAVLWPSFLMSGLATILFFTLIDPADLVIQHQGVELSRIAAYSIGFLLFWILTACTCALTCYFNRPCHPGRHSSG